MDSPAAGPPVLPTAQSPLSRAKPRLLKIGKLLILLAVIFFVAITVHEDLKKHDIHAVKFDPRFLALTALCFISGGLVSVGIRRLLLAGFCAPPPWPAMAAIAWIPQPAKYLPGKVGALAGTVWMLGRYGVRKPVTITMLFMMSAMSLTVGIILAIPLMFQPSVTDRIPHAWIWGLGALLMFLLLLHPLIFGGVSNFILRKFRRQPLEALPNLRHYVGPLLLMAVSWILQGLALWCAARALVWIPTRQIPIFVSMTALASSLGFLALTPGGLGVKELILIVVLTPFFTNNGVSRDIAPFALRLTQITIELLLAGVGMLIQRAAPPPPPDPTTHTPLFTPATVS